MTQGDLPLVLFFISCQIYSSHLYFVSISFDNFFAKFVKIRSLFIFLRKATVKWLQSMRMEC